MTDPDAILLHGLGVALDEPIRRAATEARVDATLLQYERDLLERCLRSAESALAYHERRARIAVRCAWAWYVIAAGLAVLLAREWWK